MSNNNNNNKNNNNNNNNNNSNNHNYYYYHHHHYYYYYCSCCWCCYFLLLLFLVKRMFSSIWLIWKVVAIRFSHRKRCLIVTSFDIVPSASLHLNQIFCFYLYFNIKKVILLLNTNNLYKPQTFFNQSHIASNL